MTVKHWCLEFSSAAILLALCGCGDRPDAGSKATVEQPTPQKEADLAIDLGNGIKLEMVRIPAGEFMMGSSETETDACNDEHPQHRVRITKPFYLGEYLVTQEQWQAVMGNNPSGFKGPKNPVERVSWEDCQQFLRKLKDRDHQLPASLGHEGNWEFRLPTEAQWEYACRAGGTTRYCFGDGAAGLDDYAWYTDNSGGTTHPVGEKKPNAWGLYDMQGNVGEWCEDWYDETYYGKSPDADPSGPPSGSDRVGRGGCWFNLARDCRSASRYFNDSGHGDLCQGFRVSLVLTEPSSSSSSPR